MKIDEILFVVWINHASKFNNSIIEILRLINFQSFSFSRINDAFIYPATVEIKLRLQFAHFLK